MRVATVRLANWSDTRIGAYLFVSLWLTYGFLAGDFTNSNSVTRMALIFSIIDHHALTIGDFARLTFDKALFDDRYGELFRAYRLANALWALRWYAMTGYMAGAARAKDRLDVYFAELGFA